MLVCGGSSNARDAKPSQPFRSCVRAYAKVAAGCARTCSRDRPNASAAESKAAFSISEGIDDAPSVISPRSSSFVSLV